MKTSTPAPLTLALVFLALPLSATHADDKVKWVQEHAAPIRTVDMTDEDFSDLMPLAKAIGEARIVQLGEATHGDGTAFLAKARIIRFLHEVMGFDVLLWESPMLGSRLMDAGMRDPGKSGYEAARDNIYGTWVESAQVQGLLDYIKQSQSTVSPIQTAGVDCRLGAPQHKEKLVPQYLIGFFDRVDAQLLAPKQREEIVKICKTVEYGDYYNKPGKRDLDMSVMTNLVRYLDEHQDSVLKKSSAAEARFVRQLITSEIGYEKMCDATGRKVSPTVSRDMIMGENLVWQATQMYPDRKIIVWAHNFHIMESLYINKTAEEFDRFEAASPGAGPMGHVAHRKLGREIYTIGFLGNEGSYAYANSTEPAKTIPPAPAGTLDWYLNQVDAPHVFLDFQTLAADHWLRQPLPARFYFWDESVSLWPRVFDAVFFSKQIEPSAKRPSAGR